MRRCCAVASQRRDEHRFRGRDGTDREVIIYGAETRIYRWHEVYPPEWAPLMDMCALIGARLPEHMRAVWRIGQ